MKNFCSSVPEKYDFSPAVQPYLDPYLHDTCAASHLLKGSSKYSVQLIFLSIRGKAEQNFNQADFNI